MYAVITQIGLEAFQGVRELDYNQLDGLWELVYTTADDLVRTRLIHHAQALHSRPIP